MHTWFRSGNGEKIKNGKKVSNKCFENLFVNEYLVAILQLTFNLVIVIYAVFILLNDILLWRFSLN